MITPLPDPPLRSDGPGTFADKGDTFLAALPAFVTEANALTENVNTKEASAVAAAASAAASQSAAAAFSGAVKWITGTTYAEGDVRWSPINSQSYRRKITGAGTTDPSADPTNWALLGLAGVGILSGDNTGDQTSVSGSSGSCTGNAATATRLAGTPTWNLVEIAGVLHIQVSGVSKAKLDASGNLVVVGNMTAYGTM